MQIRCITQGAVADVQYCKKSKEHKYKRQFFKPSPDSAGVVSFPITANIDKDGSLITDSAPPGALVAQFVVIFNFSNHINTNIPRNPVVMEIACASSSSSSSSTSSAAAAAAKKFSPMQTVVIEKINSKKKSSDNDAIVAYKKLLSCILKAMEYGNMQSFCQYLISSGHFQPFVDSMAAAFLTFSPADGTAGGAGAAALASAEISGPPTEPSGVEIDDANEEDAMDMLEEIDDDVNNNVNNNNSNNRKTKRKRKSRKADVEEEEEEEEEEDEFDDESEEDEDDDDDDLDEDYEE